MKNHWIKRKEDRELKEFKSRILATAKFRGKFQYAEAEKRSGRMCSIQFDGTSPSVHIDDVQIFERALNYQEVLALYDRERTCKCGKTFKTNVGHTEECLKQLERE